MPNPVIQSITPVEEGFNVTWSAVPGVSYRLLFRTDLGEGGWEGLPGDVETAGDLASKTDNTATNSQRLYRVMALP